MGPTSNERTGKSGRKVGGKGKGKEEKGK